MPRPGCSSASSPRSGTPCRPTATRASCSCSRPGRRTTTTSRASGRGRASALLRRTRRSAAGACAVRRDPRLIPLVGEAVDPVRERDEEDGVDRRKRQHLHVLAFRRQPEHREDDCAEQEASLQGAVPRRDRRLAAAALRLLPLLFRGDRLHGSLLLLLLLRLERSLVQLVAVGVEPDGLVLVPLRFQLAALLLPRRHRVTLARRRR